MWHDNVEEISYIELVVERELSHYCGGLNAHRKAYLKPNGGAIMIAILAS
jgi:hypothetical protein